MPVEKRPCKGCGQHIALTPSRHVRAHHCPHGQTCVPSYIARRRGVKGKTCLLCRGRQQLNLFDA